MKRNLWISLAIGLSLILALPQQRAHAFAFTVDSTGDESDANLADSMCQTSAGTCTLRAAIEQTNASAGYDTIFFDIGGGGVQTIQPATMLPIITGEINIDATSQPGYIDAPLIEIDGSLIDPATFPYGLVLSTSGSVVRGLSIHSFRVGIILGSGNVLESCYIGLKPDGISTGLNDTGVVAYDGSTIGGASPHQRNVISGSDSSGISLGSYNFVQGNYIGTDATGTLAVGNRGAGINTNGTSNIIGGTASGAGNLISGNGTGIGISSNAVGTGGTSNRVEGNLIGTDVTGMVALGNLSYGISINGNASSNQIGSSGSGRNVISGNSAAGVNISSTFGGPDPTSDLATLNVVRGNYIGTDINGTAAIPNGTGVILYAAQNNTVNANVISGNLRNGVLISTGAGHPYASANTITGNLIGTDRTGLVDLGNAYAGIRLQGNARANRIGLAGGSNLISGNNEDGVMIDSAGLGYAGSATGNRIAANIIGLAINGRTPLGNSHNGVFVMADGTVIGESGAGNIISANGHNGILLQGTITKATTVSYNYIGLTYTGTAAGNTQHGVLIAGARGSLIGGSTGAGNYIAYNGLNGVTLTLLAPTNRILSNNIFANTQLGIDLTNNGITPNDSSDLDSGENSLQNFPTLTVLQTTRAKVALQTRPNQTYNIQFFESTACDPSGNGEGQRYLGQQSATTGSTGFVTFYYYPATPFTSGSYITMTATDVSGNTSEFSPCYRVP